MQPAEPATPPNPASNVRRGRLLAIAEVVLILLVFFVHAGWPVPEVNEAHYLDKAKHYWQPEWIEGDFFLDSADAHVVFYWTVGWLALWFPQPAVAWIARLITWTLLAWTFRRASWAVTPRPLVAPLAAGLFLTALARGNFAGEWVVGGVEAKGIAYALVFLGIEALVRNQWRRVWIFLGAAGGVHVLVGGWSVLAAGFAWLVSGSRRTPLVKMIPSLALGFVLTLPGLLPGLALTRGVEPEVRDEANQIYVYRRLAHHLAPHTLRPEQFQSRLWRGGRLLAAFVVLSVLVGRSGRVRRLRNFAAGTIAIATVGLLICLVTPEESARAAAVLRFYWFRMFDSIVSVAVGLLAVRWLANLLQLRPTWATVVLLLALVVVGRYLGQVAVDRHYDPRPPADRKLTNTFSDPQQMAALADWRDVTRWIDANTPADAAFLTPRVAQTFRWYANRAEVVNQKDIPQSAEGIVEWWSRLQRIHRYRDEEGMHWYESLGERTPEDLRRLGSEYGARYLIVRRAYPVALPLLYENESFAVYDLGTR